MRSFLQLVGFIWALAHCVVLPGGLQAQQAGAGFVPPEVQWIPGEVILKLRSEFLPYCQPEGVQLAALNDALSRIGATGLRQKFPNAVAPISPEETGQVELRTIYSAQIPLALSPEVAAMELLKCGLLEYAEPKYFHWPMYDPADPDTLSQFYISRIQARAGWGIQQGDTNVIIGIIDTAIEWDHPDLVGNIAYNWDDPIDGLDNDGDGFVDNFHGWDMVGEDNLNPQPDNDPKAVGTLPFIEHGTAVAGHSSATPDNGIGGVGSGLYCRMLPIKASADNDSRNFAFIVGGYEGVVYVADYAARKGKVAIINCSWGGTTFNQLGLDVVNYATLNRNASVVAAAGNVQQEQANYPAAFANVLSVAGSNATDLVQTTRHPTVSVSAPGGGLTTAMGGGFSNLGTFTSYAAPITSGVVGLVRSQFPVLSARQALEQVRVTTDNTYNLAANAVHRYLWGTGRINLFRALTLTSPSVRLESFTFTDGNNNIPEPGDTLNLTLLLRNYLAPTTANLRVTLVATDTTAVRVIQPAHTYGAMGTLTNRDNTGNPFQVWIKPNAPADVEVRFRIDILDGLYTDYDFLTLTINPSFVNLDINRVQLTLTDAARLGYSDFPTNRLGIGGRYNGTNLLFEGSFVVAQNPTTVLDNMRTGQGGAKTDWRNTQRPDKRTPGQQSDQETSVSFDDSGAGSRALGLEVSVESWAFNTPQDGDFVLLDYTLTNTNQFRRLDTLRAGLLLDWDFVVGGAASNDSAAYDASRRLAYAFGRDAGAPPLLMGVVALTDTQSVLAYSIAIATGAFTDSAKFGYWAHGTDSVVVNEADVMQALGVGPFTLQPLQSKTLGFAIVGGSSLAALQANADLAVARYRCLKRPTNLQVNLGPDRTACRQTTLDGTTPGAASYLWSNGQTTPSITVTASGIYRLTVTDANGCTSLDDITITIQQAPAPRVTVPDSAFAGVPVTFRDSTPNIEARTWLFGDGYGSIAQHPSYSYPQPGTYTVTLIQQTGTCTDTLTFTLRVGEGPTSRADATHTPLRLYPNPSSGSLTVAGVASVPQAAWLTNALGQQWPISPALWHMEPDGLKLALGQISGLGRGTYFLHLHLSDGRLAILPLRYLGQ